MVCRGREFFRTITEITLPDSIVEIGERAFDECKALRSVNIPEGVVGIGKLTAIQCTALELVKLPRSLKAIAEGTSVSDNIFYFSPHLKNVIVPRG